MEPRHRLEDLRRRLDALRRAGTEWIGEPDELRPPEPESRSAGDEPAG